MSLRKVVNVVGLLQVFVAIAMLLTGLVALVYGPTRFVLDFLRATAEDRVTTPDVRYFGLTTAQYFALAIFGAGVWLLFLRKPKPGDLDYAKDSDRLAKLAAKKKAKQAADNADHDASPPEPDAD